MPMIVLVRAGRGLFCLSVLTPLWTTLALEVPFPPMLGKPQRGRTAFMKILSKITSNLLKLLTDDQKKLCPKGYRYAYQSRLSISEVMTIVILFPGSGDKTFKEFYLNVLKDKYIIFLFFLNLIKVIMKCKI
ncbi:MAG: hypothetical protein AB4372_10415 [Xenococcus sp. (in: cyanobacteria)]